MDRRHFLSVAAAGAGAAALGATGVSRVGRLASRLPALPVGALPYPRDRAGTDHLPQVDHVVVVMMENHSFDNLLGVLGRGDGLTIGAGGTVTNSNPDGKGGRLRSFHMPTPCQLSGQPTQSWDASHAQYDHGTNEGFVTSGSGPVAMGYWKPKDMPFTSSLASVYPLADRWFCSVLGPTYPNRRYLLAGTSLGLTDDQLLTPLPPHGTLLEQLDRHDISWRNYYSNLPSILVWYGLYSEKWVQSQLTPISQFYKDCAAGTLPSFSLVDPNFSTSSEENPQDIQFGDVFLSGVVDAVTSGPKWDRTLLIWTYDEHGGYYDHVPPPAAPLPDSVAPVLPAGSAPGRFDRLGFRVPAGLVSPYAKADHVSSVVYDHTSILKFVHRKWNLPSLTHRDAATNDLSDLFDFDARPAFLTPPKLHRPANAVAGDSCLRTGVGPIP